MIKQISAALVPIIAWQLCRACPHCAAQTACPHKAIVVIDRGEPPWIEPSRCFGCRSCLVACPHGAIHP